MRKIGIPTTLRIDEKALNTARVQASQMKKPLRTYLREIIERTIETEK